MIGRVSKAGRREAVQVGMRQRGKQEQLGANWWTCGRAGWG